MSDLLLDVLLPKTDRGAVMQWIVMAAVWTAVLALTRNARREYRLFVSGLIVINLAWFAVRTVH